MSLPEGFWLKVLVAGKSCHGGELTWSLPKAGAPGDWHEVTGRPVNCSRGLHLTRVPVAWWKDGASVFLAEGEEPAVSNGYDSSDDTKTAFRRARLVRELTAIELADLGIFGPGEWKIDGLRSGIALAGSNVVALASSNVEARGSSKVEAWDNSNVVARDSSNVVAWDSSKVVAWGSSNVEARGSSNVEARDSSNVEARDSSKVEAWGSSKVVAWGSSNVEARGSSNVEARDSSNVVALASSNVEARDSSNVVARGSSKVEAWDNSNVVARGSSKVEARDRSVIAKPSGCDLGCCLNNATATVSDRAVLVDQSGAAPVVTTAAGKLVPEPAPAAEPAKAPAKKVRKARKPVRK